MVSRSSVVLALALCTIAAATKVEQCSEKSMDSEREVELIPCKNIPCKLKKGTEQHITFKFTPTEDAPVIKNKVSAEVFGIPLPFIGVDGSSICDKIYTESGEKVSCPLKAGTKYAYKDKFPILVFYPTIDYLKVHWALQDANEKNIACFEVPAKIVK